MEKPLAPSTKTCAFAALYWRKLSHYQQRLTTVNFEECLPGLAPRQKPKFPVSCARSVALLNSADNHACESAALCQTFVHVFKKQQLQLKADEEYGRLEVIPRSVWRQATKSNPANWNDVNRCKRCMLFTYENAFRLYFTDEMKKYDPWMALCASCVLWYIKHDNRLRWLDIGLLRFDYYRPAVRQHESWHTCTGSSRDCVATPWRSAVVILDHHHNNNHNICAFCADEYEAQTRKRHWDQQALPVLLNDVYLVTDVVQLISTFFLGRHFPSIVPLS